MSYQLHVITLGILGSFYKQIVLLPFLSLITMVNSNHKKGINQLGGEYANGRALPLDIRWRIVQMSLLGYRPCHISRHLLVSHGCVSKIISRFSSTGSIFPGTIGGSKPRVSTPEVVRKIIEYKKKNGSVLARQIRSQLIADSICQENTLPSISSINRILRNVRIEENSLNKQNSTKTKCKESKKPKSIPSNKKPEKSFFIKDILELKK